MSDATPTLFESRCREALEVARLRLAAVNLTLDEELTKLPRGGSSLMDYRDGQKDILDIFEAAISGDWPEPPPLPARLYGRENPDATRALRAGVVQQIDLPELSPERCGACGGTRDVRQRGWADEGDPMATCETCGAPDA